MDDRRLQNLLRMAAEIDALERAAGQAVPRETPELRLVGTENVRAGSTRRNPFWVRLVGASLAASVVVAGLVSWRLSTTPEPTQIADRTVQPAPHRFISSGQPEVRPVSTEGETLAAADTSFDPRKLIVEALPHLQQLLTDEHFVAAQQAMLLVIYRGADDRCLCVEPVQRQLAAGEDLASVTRTELISAALNVRCDQNPERVVVFGLAGPVEHLPESRTEAAQFASCILSPSEEATENPDPGMFATAAALCLPPEVSVVAETIRVGRSQ